MRSVPVVVMNPALEHGSALRGMIISKAVSPFTQCRLDEALGLTVSLWPVSSGEAVLQAEATAGIGEDFGPERRTVVGEEVANPHAQRLEIGDGVAQELGGAVFALIGIHVGESDAGMIIDGHEQKLPASPLHGVASIAGDAMAHALDASQLLGVN